MKTAAGRGKMAKFAPVDSISTTSKTVMPINPMTLMMAVALASIENRLGEIIEMQKTIMSFLEEKQEAEVEGDIKTLSNIIKEYKFNWDNSEYTQNHHKLALDIKRKADQNIIFYQKQVGDIYREKSTLYINKTADDIREKLQKKFEYYRMALFTYSFASFLEVMLLGNFNADYIQQITEKIENYALEYRNLFTKCSERLEGIVGKSVEMIAGKSLGGAAKAVGQSLGNVPFIKDTQVDDWLIKKGNYLENTSDETAKKCLRRFAEFGDPGSGLFVERLQQINRIYNQTAAIYIDKDSVYLSGTCL